MICMKQNNIVHRDLKLENILLKDFSKSKLSKLSTLENSKFLKISSDFSQVVIKIADFGLADILPSKGSIKTRCGTPGYMAPEIFSPQGYNEQCDVFSAGIILYILLINKILLIINGDRLNGSPPFTGKNMKSIVKKTQNQKIHFSKNN